LEFRDDLIPATKTFAVSLLVGKVCCGVATMLADDGSGVGPEGRLAARLVTAARKKALTTSLRSKVCRGVL
jgi:hypothetical protein